MRKFKAAVFDWAGTRIDFGSFAPIGVFVRAFAEFGIKATIAQARAPMGSAKWDHIRAMMDMAPPRGAACLVEPGTATLTGETGAAWHQSETSAGDRAPGSACHAV
ncbi:hypothetical protein EV663_101263 [Rhodovulum bhavnagarense]|uniref:Phosphonoacetaldehyde hydrolase n=1 Tax=Rhodovulum bhavnagarense TaxID=992286 RepID=A0A4R2RH34_9RHOB|nr:hypothetical protein [Rhodovulum bhavnagarense]TCP63000.1 hypothetical protein EV663_101263 [Rhodovulum bhavnagarense]